MAGRNVFLTVAYRLCAAVLPICYCHRYYTYIYYPFQRPLCWGVVIFRRLFLLNRSKNFVSNYANMGVATPLISAHFKSTKSKPPHWLHSWTSDSLVGREGNRYWHAGAICNQFNILSHLPCLLYLLPFLWLQL